MELDEFIKEVVTSIALTTSELQSQLSELGCVLNPPSDANCSHTFVQGSSVYNHRRVMNVDFDVAVTVTTSKEGSAGGKVKVFSVVDVGADGRASVEETNASRVRFSIPISLPESPEGRLNHDEMTRIQDEVRSQKFQRRKVV